MSGANSRGHFLVFPGYTGCTVLCPHRELMLVTVSSPVRLLVVDDLEDNRALLRRRFEKRGYEIVEAHSGSMALDLVAQHDFDLVLLDIMMPGLNGMEVLKTIRTTYSPDQLPVIMVTARAESADIIAALELGANDYLIKPVNFPVAFARVQTQISRKQAEYARSQAQESLELSIKDLAATNRQLQNAIQDRTISDERVEYLVVHDALTGLDNRVRFRARLERALQQVDYSSKKLAVIFFDIDDFRLLNDTLGNTVGDSILADVATCLRRFIPEAEAIARIGGDEFAAILTVKAPEEAVELASTIAEAIANPHGVGVRHIVIDVSIGIALAPNDGRDAELLISNAHLALQRAKADGGASCRFFEAEMNIAAQARQTLKSDLRRALVAEEFEVYYQPLFGLAANAISGFEALLRWRHPERGMVSPAEFIPLAEETGLIVTLGEMVLRRACIEAASWPTQEKIAVNISPVQFRGKGIIPAVISALAASRLPANRLEIEITESIALDGDSRTVDALYHLRDMGVGISLDDFGTGYSSLSYLRLFPFSKLKIDQSFIREIGLNSGTTAIVRSLLDLATHFGMVTTAEGVETKEQRDWLLANGCAEIQGYLISRPVCSRDVASLVVKQHRQVA